MDKARCEKCSKEHFIRKDAFFVLDNQCLILRVVMYCCECEKRTGHEPLKVLRLPKRHVFRQAVFGQ